MIDLKINAEQYHVLKDDTSGVIQFWTKGLADESHPVATYGDIRFFHAPLKG